MQLYEKVDCHGLSFRNLGQLNTRESKTKLRLYAVATGILRGSREKLKNALFPKSKPLMKQRF